MKSHSFSVSNIKSQIQGSLYQQQNHIQIFPQNYILIPNQLRQPQLLNRNRSINGQFRQYHTQNVYVQHNSLNTSEKHQQTLKKQIKNEVKVKKIEEKNHINKENLVLKISQLEQQLVQEQNKVIDQQKIQMHLQKQKDFNLQQSLDLQKPKIPFNSKNYNLTFLTTKLNSLTLLINQNFSTEQQSQLCLYDIVEFLNNKPNESIEESQIKSQEEQQFSKNGQSDNQLTIISETLNQLNKLHSKFTDYYKSVENKVSQYYNESQVISDRFEQKYEELNKQQQKCIQKEEYDQAQMIENDIKTLRTQMQVQQQEYFKKQFQHGFYQQFIFVIEAMKFQIDQQHDFYQIYEREIYPIALQFSEKLKKVQIQRKLFEQELDQLKCKLNQLDIEEQNLNYQFGQNMNEFDKQLVSQITNEKVERVQTIYKYSNLNQQFCQNFWTILDNFPIFTSNILNIQQQQINVDKINHKISQLEVQHQQFIQLKQFNVYFFILKEAKNEQENIKLVKQDLLKEQIEFSLIKNKIMNKLQFIQEQIESINSLKLSQVQIDISILTDQIVQK